METKEIEHNILIAERVPPGDNWYLVTKPNTTYPSLTDTLEAYFQNSSTPCPFRLEPMNGKLFAIISEEEEVVEVPIKKYNIYGD